MEYFGLSYVKELSLAKRKKERKQQQKKNLLHSTLFHTTIEAFFL